MEIRDELTGKYINNTLVFAQFPRGRSLKEKWVEKAVLIAHNMRNELLLINDLTFHRRRSHGLTCLLACL